MMGALLGQDAGDIALTDARTGRRLSFSDLVQRIDAIATRLALARSGLVLICPDQSIEAVTILLGAWRAGHAVFLYRPRSSEALAAASSVYRPCWTIAPASLMVDRQGATPLIGDYLAVAERDPGPVDPDLALLLSTSGSMSAPRTVRVGGLNLGASLEQITQCLSPHPQDRMLLALPIAHIYGLTSLLSHLMVGATTILDRVSVLDPRFGLACEQYEVSTLPAVSFMLDMLRATAWRNGVPQSLRRLTHSGDRLGDATLAWAIDLQRQGVAAFYRMYGMTETSGRISVLAPEDLISHPGSVGRPVPGGAVRFDNGEIVFAGPNAGRGYAVSSDDLEVLPPAAEVHTGDLGHQDADGFLYLTGRRSRLAKILGVRISLDEVEAALASVADIAAVAGSEQIVLYAPLGAEDGVLRRLDAVAEAFSIPRTQFMLRLVDDIPRTATGKILYAQLPPS